MGRYGYRLITVRFNWLITAFDVGKASIPFTRGMSFVLEFGDLKIHTS